MTDTAAQRSLRRYRQEHRQTAGVSEPDMFGCAGTSCAPSSRTTAGSTVSNPTSCLRSGRLHVGQRQRAPADEIATADRPAKAKIIRNDGAIGLLTDNDKTLLGAQDVHRIGAVWGCITLPQSIPDRWASPDGRLISKPSSPVKLTRNSLIETPPKRPSRTLMCGIARRSMSRMNGASTASDRGPCTAITAHCSVIDVSHTRMSANSVCR